MKQSKFTNKECETNQIDSKGCKTKKNWFQGVWNYAKLTKRGVKLSKTYTVHLSEPTKVFIIYSSYSEAISLAESVKSLGILWYIYQRTHPQALRFDMHPYINQ
jgi:hypothetical protein